MIPLDYPVETRPPDISPYAKGNTGIPYVHTFDSGLPGPHVCVNALTHGNEYSGAIAVDWLFRHDVRPVRGRLSLSFANVEAFHRFDPADPWPTRGIDQDLNRVWGDDMLDGPLQTVELRRAREMRPFVETIDLLLDLHSTHTAMPPAMMTGPLNKEKARRLAAAIGAPATVIADDGHSAGVRLVDYKGFSDPDSPKNSLAVECGQHWEAAAVPFAIAISLEFLHAVGAVAAGFGAEARFREKPRQRFYDVTHAVTIRTDDLRFVAPFVGMEVIAKAGTVIAHDGGTPIATPYDDCVLVQPANHPQIGATAVRLARERPWP